MANPNINTATNIYANNIQLNLTSTSGTLLVSNSSSSGKVYLIDNITVTNVDTVNACDVTVVRYRSEINTGTAFPLTSVITVPSKAALIVIGGENGQINLTEGQSIYVTASAANDLVVDCNWKEIS